jgi:hypothetical protein
MASASCGTLPQDSTSEATVRIAAAIPVAGCPRGNSMVCTTADFNAGVRTTILTLSNKVDSLRIKMMRGGEQEPQDYVITRTGMNVGPGNSHVVLTFGQTLSTRPDELFGKHIMRDESGTLQVTNQQSLDGCLWKADAKTGMVTLDAGSLSPYVNVPQGSQCVPGQSITTSLLGGFWQKPAVAPPDGVYNWVDSHSVDWSPVAGKLQLTLTDTRLAAMKQTTSTLISAHQEGGNTHVKMRVLGSGSIVVHCGAMPVHFSVNEGEQTLKVPPNCGTVCLGHVGNRGCMQVVLPAQPKHHDSGWDNFKEDMKSFAQFQGDIFVILEYTIPILIVACQWGNRERAASLGWIKATSTKSRSFWMGFAAPVVFVYWLYRRVRRAGVKGLMVWRVV